MLLPASLIQVGLNMLHWGYIHGKYFWTYFFICLILLDQLESDILLTLDRHLFWKTMKCLWLKVYLFVGILWCWGRARYIRILTPKEISFLSLHLGMLQLSTLLCTPYNCRPTINQSSKQTDRSINMKEEEGVVTIINLAACLSKVCTTQGFVIILF